MNNAKAPVGETSPTSVDPWTKGVSVDMRYLVYVQAGQMVVRSTQSRTKTQVGRIDAAMAGGNVICDKEW